MRVLPRARKQRVIQMKVKVIGAGLAGCEAAWQLAKAGIPVDLYEMKPKKYSPAHKYQGFAFVAPFYPFEKVSTGFNTLKGADLIPGILIKYLLDLPDANGYVPVDDNSRPRVRLAKYLWYDEPNPLSKNLPTPEEKLSMLFNGENAELTTEEDKAKHPKGYRLYGQSYWMATGLKAKVLLKCFM